MARKNFHHPFTPYDIQQEFMQAVYDCIENGKVGIFESPTGTGKSLSLICGSLTWLREHKRKLFDASMIDLEVDDDEPAWLTDHTRSMRYKEALAMRNDFEERLQRMRSREATLRKKSGAPEPARKKLKLEDECEDEDLELDDYCSDDNSRTGSSSAYSASTAQMLAKLGLLADQNDKQDLHENDEEVKIFFCSRTHSQLSQLIGELRRVQLPATLPPEDDKPDEERVRQIALGSRKNLCINPKVNKLSTQTAINERCLELQQSSTSAEQRCPYLPKQDQADRMLDFRDSALSDIRDIEDLALVGKTLETCPYYASRAAIGPAEVITLPYPLLLQKASRDALGISLKGSVVIIDEAHNLVGAVESTYSTQISDTQLKSARSNLIAYLQKYRNRLAGSNRIYVAQLVRLMDSLLAVTTALLGSGGTVAPATLLAGKGVDQINLPKLVRYIHESKIARKVESYAAKKAAAESESAAEVPTLTLLAGFVLSLINPTAEGSFFWSRISGQIILQYLLLDPSQHFRDILDESRAVILAGGTMSPMEDHIQQLFPHLTDVRTLSCGHIVPTSSLLVRTIPSDAVGSFDFTFKTRSDKGLMRRVGQMLVKIAGTMKGGLVVFFASYSYLDMMHQEWKTSGLLASMQTTKPIFFDGRTQSAETTFQAYSETVRTDNRGAMLCSVIGGKLSEGINFSDELGRCVVVVGLPYPNLETPEWKAKIQYLETKNLTRPDIPKSNISRDFAENVCMRAVNQAIGRAIRHRNDWASIVLVDARYAQPRIQAKLPAWIRGSLPDSAEQTSQDAVSALCVNMQRFFTDHQS